ncbi:MAG TPA: DUF2007 domain-containing protein [Thermoguttaceae bacterium]
MDEPELVDIYSSANAIEAYAVANALEAAGIKARVVGEFSGGYPLLAFPREAPRVCVRKADEIRARDLLKQWKAEIETDDSVE